MSIQLQSVPTTNSVEFRATFLLNNEQKATLANQQADTLTIEFDAIGIGSSDPLSIYQQETPGAIHVTPGNLAFLDRSESSRIALHYGTQGGIQQNIFFRLEA